MLPKADMETLILRIPNLGYHLQASMFFLYTTVSLTSWILRWNVYANYTLVSQTDGQPCMFEWYEVYIWYGKTLHLMLIAMLDSRRNDHWNQTIGCWIRHRRCRRSKHPLSGPWRCLEETGAVKWRPFVTTSETPWSYRYNMALFLGGCMTNSTKKGPYKVLFNIHILSSTF